MSSEIDLVKFIVRQIIPDKERGVKGLLKLDPINWEKLKDLIIYHDLTPFAYLVLKGFNSFLHQDLMGFLKNNYFCALVRHQRMWQEFLRIVNAFEQAEITILPIK